MECSGDCKACEENSEGTEIALPSEETQNKSEYWSNEIDKAIAKNTKDCLTIEIAGTDGRDALDNDYLLNAIRQIQCLYKMKKIKKAYIITDLINIDKEFLNTIAEEELNKFFEIAVILYGNNKQTYEKLYYAKKSWKGNYERSVKNLKMLVDYKADNLINIRELIVKYPMPSKPDFKNLVDLSVFSADVLGVDIVIHKSSKKR
jgi:hypothetical protein